MKLRIGAAGCAVLLLSGCLGGPSATDAVTKAEERTGFMGLSKKDQVSVTSAEAFKGAEQVIIGGFTVGFAVNKTDSRKAGGGLMGNGFGGKSTARSSLTGVSDADMQAITDAAYADFVAQLQAKGYTVADRAPMIQSEAFKSVTPQPVPYEDTQGGLLGGGNTTRYFAPSQFGGLLTFLGDIPGNMGGFGFSNPSMAAQKYAAETRQKVLHVIYLVDFANANGHGGWHTSSSSVQVGQGLTVVPEYTKLSLIGGQAGTFSTANGAIALGQPVSSDKPFATVNDSTSDAGKALEVATNVVGALGGIGTNSSRRYEFVANPAQYRDASLDALAKANATFLDTMAGLK